MGWMLELVLNPNKELGSIQILTEFGSIKDVVFTEGFARSTLFSSFHKICQAGETLAVQKGCNLVGKFEYMKEYLSIEMYCKSGR